MFNILDYICPVQAWEEQDVDFLLFLKLNAPPLG